jgi:hypothetical protein
MQRLWGEEFGEKGEHLCACQFVDLSHAFHQPAFVYGPDLIQHDLSRLSLESHRDAGRIKPTFRRYGGDDDGVDVLVHFVRIDDQAGAGLTDFTAFGGVEANEKEVEAGHYHVHSLRSQADGAADS